MFRVTKEDRDNLKKVIGGFTRKKSDEEVFYDLCFCLMAPQTTFKANTKVINDLKLYGVMCQGFYKVPEHPLMRTHLEIMLKPVRFYRNKTKYLMEAKKNFKEILHHIDIYNLYKHAERNSAKAMRGYLVDNVKGLGMKAASHFMRNLGDSNLAIIDTHIIKFLKEEEPKCDIDKLKSLATSKQGYCFLEDMFSNIAKKRHLTIAELDALVWKKYSNTDWKEFIH